MRAARVADALNTHRLLHTAERRAAKKSTQARVVRIVRVVRGELVTHGQLRAANAFLCVRKQRLGVHWRVSTIGAG